MHARSHRPEVRSARAVWADKRPDLLPRHAPPGSAMSTRPSPHQKTQRHPRHAADSPSPPRAPAFGLPRVTSRRRPNRLVTVKLHPRPGGRSFWRWKAPAVQGQLSRSPLVRLLSGACFRYACANRGNPNPQTLNPKPQTLKSYHDGVTRPCSQSLRSESCQCFSMNDEPDGGFKY